MPLAYKVLICLRATGQVLNTDAKTLFSYPAEAIAPPVPYHYFDSFAEAEQFACQLHQANPSVEMSLYVGDDYLQSIPPDEWQGRSPVMGPTKSFSERPGVWSRLKRLLRFDSLK